MYFACVVTFLILLSVGIHTQPTCVSYQPISEGVLWNLNNTIAQSFQITKSASSLHAQFYRDSNLTVSFSAKLYRCDDYNCTTQISTSAILSSNEILDIEFSSVNLVAGQTYQIHFSNNTAPVLLKLSAANLNGTLFINGLRNETSDLAYVLCLDPGCAPCYSDSDCSHQGLCATSPSLSFGYCSCFSGFGGCDCSSRPDTQCSFSPVSVMTNNFKANVTLDYQYPVLVIGVNANLEESKFLTPAFNNTLNSPPYSEEFLMYFGTNATAYPGCSFPVGSPYEIDWKDFAATSSDCTDKYLMNMTWSTAKNQCGFSSTDGSRTFTQTITIQRWYLMEYSGTRRIEQTTRFLNVIFPSEVQISTSSFASVAFPPANVTAIIVSNDYDPYTELWKVVVQTSVVSPYILQLPFSTIATGAVSDRLVNVSLSAVSGCTSQTASSCVQHFTYLFNRGSSADSCLGLVGSVTSLANVTCTTPNCPSNTPANLTMVLNTGNACPVTDQIDWSQTSLNTYSDASATTVRSEFTINDVAYFGAVVETTEAVITSRTVEPGSVCFQAQSGSCIPVAFSVLSSTNGKDPVFSVNFRDSANFGIFSNSTQPTSYSVKATIQVTFATKSMKNKPATQKASVSVNAVVNPSAEKENEKDSDTSMTVPMIAAGAVGVLIVIGGLVAMTLFYRRKNARRVQSMRHIDSVYNSRRSSQMSINEDRNF